MQNFRTLGAQPPDPKTAPPHCEFLATHLEKILFFAIKTETKVQETVFIGKLDYGIVVVVHLFIEVWMGSTNQGPYYRIFFACINNVCF